MGTFSRKGRAGWPRGDSALNLARESTSTIRLAPPEAQSSSCSRPIALAAGRNQLRFHGSSLRTTTNRPPRGGRGVGTRGCGRLVRRLADLKVTGGSAPGKAVGGTSRGHPRGARSRTCCGRTPKRLWIRSAQAPAATLAVRLRDRRERPVSLALELAPVGQHPHPQCLGRCGRRLAEPAVHGCRQHPQDAPDRVLATAAARLVASGLPVAPMRLACGQRSADLPRPRNKTGGETQAPCRRGSCVVVFSAGVFRPPACGCVGTSFRRGP